MAAPFIAGISRMAMRASMKENKVLARKSLLPTHRCLVTHSKKSVTIILRVYYFIQQNMQTLVFGSDLINTLRSFKHEYLLQFRGVVDVIEKTTQKLIVLVKGNRGSM